MHLPPGVSVRAIVTIRDAVEADEASIVEISNRVFPDHHETLEEFRENRARLRAGGFALALAVAATPDGEVVGFWQVNHMPEQFDPGRYLVRVFVDPAWQRWGVGGTLYEHVLGSLSARGARAVESFARESMPEVAGFLSRRGFRETMRTWETRLDVARFDPAPFAAYLARVHQAGVTITTLADEQQRDPDVVRRAYDLYNAVLADIPSPIPYTPISFEHYLRGATNSSRALLDAYFLAKVGDAYVGQANLWRPREGTHLYHNVTGVLPAYRGRGIAMALKLSTIAFGQAGGYSEIRTWNEQYNAGILAINDRLGFVRQPAWLTFEKTLQPASTR